MLKYILNIILALAALSSAANAKFYINSTLGKLSKVELKNSYLKKEKRGQYCFESTDKKLKRAFYQRALKKTPKQLHAYWIKEIYRGTKTPPKKETSKESLLAAQSGKKRIWYSWKKTPYSFLVVE